VVTASTIAEPLVKTLYGMILERGGHPHVLFDFQGQDEIFFARAQDSQLELVPIFHQLAYDQFDVLIKLRSETNTRALSGVNPERQAHRQKALAKLLHAQMKRGAEKSLRWMSTQFPTNAYAMEADMGYEEYQDFFYRAIHADTSDPVNYWESVREDQQRIIDRIQGHDRIEIRGPDVEMSISILGRTFRNACGEQNMPDGEIYTGPVEDSANGWVRYTYPAVFQGRVVEGIELKFERGKVVEASSSTNQEFLLKMLATDAGAKYIGEFAIGTNFEVNRFTRNILFDEKIGGSFHLALGAGYPETGSQNKSQIHWDMICDLRNDSEILVDSERIYRNGKFEV
jgi:aminopeptidase